MATVQQLRIAATQRIAAWLPVTKRQEAASWLTVAAVAIVPLGTFGPLDWVWIVALVLAAAAALMVGISESAVRDIGLLAAFALWVTATLAWSPYPAAGTAMVVPVWTAVAVYLAVRGLSETPLPAMIRQVAVVWIVVLVAAMAYVSVAPNSINTIANDTPVRHAAMALAGLILIALSTRRRATLGVVVSLAGLAAAVVTGSRMASAVIFGILAVTLITNRRRGPQLVVLGSVLAALTLAVVPSLTEPATAFVDNVVERGLNGSNRPDVWATTWDSCGPSVFGSGAGTANTIASTAHNGFPDPHNEVIRFACDTGLVGSILLWSFFGVAIWHAVKLVRARPRNQLALNALLALLSVLVFSIVWNPITAAEFMVPVMVLVALADGVAERVRQSDHRTSLIDYSADV